MVDDQYTEQGKAMLEEEQREIDEMRAYGKGCHYCRGPLDATRPTGVYECPHCLENFPNTESVADILAERDSALARVKELEADIVTMSRCQRCGSMSICDECYEASGGSFGDD